MSGKSKISWVLLIIASFSWGEGLLPHELSAATSDGRLRVFISDLHFGVGRDPATMKWHKEEDFRWGEEFALFLKEINRKGNGLTDLILNGDTFELWQSLNKDCKYEDKDLGCTEEEALTRIMHVVSEHAPELRAIGQFADAGQNQVILIPGNHDAALLFPRVKDTVLQAISAQPGRVVVASEGNWRSPDGLLHAEHGHQIGKEVNKWGMWPRPFTTKNGTTYLQRPWGEQFVQEYYNQFEHTYSIIDNISVEGEGVRYGMSAEGKVKLLEDIAGFVNFVFFKVSWDQFTSGLGEQDGTPPKWDTAAIKAEGPRFFLDSIPNDHPFYGATKQALEEGKLTASFLDVARNENDIRTICDERAALVKIQKELPTSERTMTECPRQGGTLGALGEALFRARNTVLAEHLEKICRNLEGCVQNPFSVFVFSHTHLAVPGYSPIKNGSWRPLVINTGAWQRVVTPNELSMLRQERHLTDAEVLNKLEPEDLPACYSVILIPAYTETEKPTPVLRYWKQQQEGGWGFSSSSICK